MCGLQCFAGVLEVLSQLTVVGKVNAEEFRRRFRAMKQCSGTYFIVVVEDLATHRIVASASAIVELKFIHACGQVAHVEDVVVDSTYRGHRLGKAYVATRGVRLCV